MPIHQSRVIELINAGRDYADALRFLRTSAQNGLDAISEGKSTPALEWQNLSTMLANPAAILREAEKSASVLAREEAHFKAMARENERAKKARQRKRSGWAVHADEVPDDDGEADGPLILRD